MLNNKLPSAINKKHSGMTVIELVVAMSIATLIVTGMLAVITHIFTTRTNATRQMMVVKETQDVIDSVTRDLRFTDSFLPSNDIADAYASESPTPGTWNFTGTERTDHLILKANATEADYRNPDNELLFVNLLGSSDCPTVNEYFMVNIIYYVNDDNELLRRTIAPQGENIACSGSNNNATPFQSQTCLSPSAGTHCTNRDILIASNVSDFSITYLQIPYDPEDEPFDEPTPASSIRLNITINDESSRLIEPSSASILLSKGAI